MPICPGSAVDGVHGASRHDDLCHGRSPATPRSSAPRISSRSRVAANFGVQRSVHAPARRGCRGQLARPQCSKTVHLVGHDGSDDRIAGAERDDPVSGERRQFTPADHRPSDGCDPNPQIARGERRDDAGKLRAATYDPHQDLAGEGRVQQPVGSREPDDPRRRHARAGDFDARRGRRRRSQCPASPRYRAADRDRRVRPEPRRSSTISDVDVPRKLRAAPTGDARKTWRANDALRQPVGSAVSQTIHVVDTTAPVISALPGTGADDRVPGDAAVHATPTASDACDPNPQTLTFARRDDAREAARALTTARKTWTGEGSRAATSRARRRQTIHVVDTTAPVIAGCRTGPDDPVPGDAAVHAADDRERCVRPEPQIARRSRDVTTPGNCPQAPMTRTETWRRDGRVRQPRSTR